MVVIRPARALRAVLSGAVALALGMASAPPAGADPGREPPTGPTAVARARVAADVLMSSYEPEKAWFPSSWWNSAVALQTIGDYMQRTGDRRYLTQLDNTFETDKGAFPAGVPAPAIRSRQLHQPRHRRLRVVGPDLDHRPTT